MSAEEVILPYPAAPTTVTRVRSTLVLASRNSLTASGHAARYAQSLSPETAKLLSESVVGLWLPIEVALSHYQAAEALQLPPSVVGELGRGTNERMKGMFYGTFVRVFKEAG